jgi:hypothetical protein
MLMSPFGATAQNHLLLADEQLTRFMNNVQLDNKPQPFFLDKDFMYIYYKTPFFDNGHKRAIYGFQVAGQHRDYFLVTINSNMRSFTMKTRVSPVFLNIMMWASGELDRAHLGTTAILAGMHETPISLCWRLAVTSILFGPKGLCTPSHLSASQTPAGSCCGIRVAANSTSRGGHPSTLIQVLPISRLQYCV